MPPVAVQPIDSGREVSNALNLLAERWTLAIPTAVSSLVCSAIVFFVIGAVVVGVVAGAIVGHAAGAIAALGAGATGIAAAVLAIAVIAYAAHVLVVAAARDVWEGRDPDFGAALRLTLERAPALALAFAIIGLVLVVPILLSFVLIGIPLVLAVQYGTLYVIPAIVFGGEDAVTAIATSVRIATRRWEPTLAAFGAIVVAFIIGRCVDAFCVHIPGLGLMAAFVVGGFTAGYAALVQARFYALLRNA